GSPGTNTAGVTFTTNPLAVTWGGVYAYRQNHSLKIQWSTAQEINTSHFDVERSINGRDWDLAIPFVPAHNLSTAYTYMQTDADYITEKVYYRIKQTDKNGHFTYSSVVMVGADNGIDKVIVYPVPVQNGFHVDNINPKNIKKMELITLNGGTIRTWFSAQSSYDISNITQGMYILKITTTDDTVIFSKLTKQ
ncbi:MAG: T9SS type A sorting domain-containing protein, partial [Ferruginibacter sp.]